jgi:opacity protein-like surface antigen
MKRLVQLVCIVFVLMTVSTQKANAQYYFYDNNYYDNPITFEIGGSIAGMNCFTDLGGKKGVGKRFIKDLVVKNTKLAGSVYASATYRNAVTLRLEGTFGQIQAYDSILKNVKTSTYGRYERNLSFRSNISEIMLAAEIHPLYLLINWEEREQDPPRLSPYLLAGVGYFSFNPQAKLGNRWVDLQPLSTEGQGFKEFPSRKVYSLKQVSYPVGAGFRYELSSLFTVRAELVYRILTTDYLDDVSKWYIDPTIYSNYFSGTKLTNALLLNDRHYELNPGYVTFPGDQRGDPRDNDAFFTFNVKVGLTLGRQRIKRH